MRILSVNTGRPRDVEYRGRTVSTAIFKQPVAGPVAVLRHNLDGDGQADLSVHGGPDKAVYAYAAGNHAFWHAELPGIDFGWGQFGENLTIDDFVESDIRPGDVFAAGTATLEVSQPRMPCFKLGIRFGDPTMVDRFLAANRSGFYLRVIAEGIVQAGDPFERISTDADSISIAGLVRLYADAPADASLLSRAIASPGLSDGWRRQFELRLDRLHTGSARNTASANFPVPGDLHPGAGLLGDQRE